MLNTIHFIDFFFPYRNISASHSALSELEWGKARERMSGIPSLQVNKRAKVENGVEVLDSNDFPFPTVNFYYSNTFMYMCTLDNYST